MFESITLFNQNSTETSKPLDIGSLVECMLFYDKTNVVANKNILKQLLTYFGVDRIIELIDEELLNITYISTGIGVFTKTINDVQYHSAVKYSSPQHTYQGELRKICNDVVGSGKIGRKAVQKIKGLIKVEKHGNIILEDAFELFLDQEYINYSAKSIIQLLIPERIDINDIEFHTEKTEKGIIVATNIDFLAINNIYQKYSQSKITSAHILNYTLGTECELYFSSNNLSEIATSDLSARLMSHRVNQLLEKSIESSKEIHDFQSFVFDDAKSLREAVNNNQINLDDLISVLKNSKKFKKWISGVKPTQDLIKSYYAEVTKQTIVDKLPGKSVRWSIFTGAGIAAGVLLTGGIGAAVGVGLSALDTFYLDKLISGWKPSQFIEAEVKKLLIKNTLRKK